MDRIVRHLRRHAFHRWANLSFLSALEGLAAPPERCVTLFAHLVASDSLWLDRLLGRVQTMAVWPEVGVAEARRRLARVAEEWDAYLAAIDESELERTVEYVNSQGEPWSNRVDDVLTHLVIHGAHHRGQMATTLREAGVSPPYTDFIHAVRTGALP